MRKLHFLAACAALLLATGIPVGAQEKDGAAEPSVNLVNRQYDFQQFTVVTLSHAFQVELCQGESWQVAVQVPDYLEEYLRVRCADQILAIGLDRVPVKLQPRIAEDREQMKVWITLPALHRLEVSEAVKVHSEGVFNVGADPFSIQLSGAAKVSGLRVAGTRKCEVECSGAASLSADFGGDFSSGEFNLSGAAKMKVTASVRKLDIVGSGASECSVDGTFDQGVIRLSGTAKAYVRTEEAQFRGNSVDIHASGVAKAEVSFPVRQGNVSLSGVSSCRIAVAESLAYELTGTSTCSYQEAGENVSLRGNASRGTQLKRL